MQKQYITTTAIITESRDTTYLYFAILFVLQLEVAGMKSAVTSSSSVAMLQENASPRGGNATTTKIVKMARTNTTVVSTLLVFLNAIGQKEVGNKQ